MPAFLRVEASAKVSHPAAAGLSFAERVSYQRAIEEVYWRHRIWPKDNPQPKPSLDAIVSEGHIEQKVHDYLRKSQFVAEQRGQPITASELQDEMDRMASHSKQPETLRELFAALRNDPFVIAECLARPTLAERLAAGSTVVQGVPPAPRSLSAAAKAFGAASTENRILAANLDNSAYKLPAISEDCVDDTWTGTNIVNAPDGRTFYSGVWTGSEMIVWGGFNSNGRLNTGGRYDPSTDSWLATAINNAPSPRDYHSAVWTGTEMIVWGGEPILNSGARYNPITDTWTATSTTNAPAARAAHTAVWTGSEMIVWAGRNEVGRLNSGGRYDPSTDSWTATNTINAPEARWYHTVEWTGSEMIVWGGTNQTIYLNTGGRYNPKTDSWMPTGLVNAPVGRIAHTAIWSGIEMSIWGGVDNSLNALDTGGRYNPITDGWTATDIVGAPSGRCCHTAVWTGSEMIVWGGYCCSPPIDFDTGGRYNPTTDTWIAVSTANAPHARDSHTAVWTGSEMIVWGGGYFAGNGFIFLNTGGRYCAQSGATPTPTPTATATPSSTATPTPTATPTSTPRVTPTPRVAPTPRARPTPRPRPRP